MSDEETVTMSEELFDAHLNSAHWSGRASSLEDFSKELRKQAGDFFARGNDREAGHYRDAADLADRKAKLERDRHKDMRALVDSLAAPPPAPPGPEEGP